MGGFPAARSSASGADGLGNGCRGRSSSPAGCPSHSGAVRSLTQPRPSLHDDLEGCQHSHASPAFALASGGSRKRQSRGSDPMGTMDVARAAVAPGPACDEVPLGAGKAATTAVASARRVRAPSPASSSGSQSSGFAAWASHATPEARRVVVDRLASSPGRQARGGQQAGPTPAAKRLDSRPTPQAAAGRESADHVEGRTTPVGLVAGVPAMHPLHDGEPAAREDWIAEPLGFHAKARRHDRFR